MIGIDLTRTSRFYKIKKNFINRILTKEELENYKNSKNKFQFLAVHWAIKEACFKADLNFKKYKNINITKDEVGRYIIKNSKCNLSVSHEEDLVIAIAIC